MFGRLRHAVAQSSAQTFLCALGAMFALAGCQPQIGDHCTLSTDCSSRGDRLCDTSQNDGYCTIFNCVGDDCPSEAVCVLFGSAGCAKDDRRYPRTARSLCVRKCNDDTDCRTAEGYVCVDPATDPYRAMNLSDVSTKVCLFAASGVDQLKSQSDPGAPVCSVTGNDVPPIDASAPADAGVDAAMEAGLDAGVDAEADAAMDSGADAADATGD